jgi:replicative DNA helicase
MEKQAKYPEIDLQMRRVMPHDNTAEQAVIGSMLYDNACIERVHLSPHDFYSAANALIFSAVMELSESGKTADIVTVCEHLLSSGNIKKCGGQAYVASVVDAVISTAAVSSYAAIVRDKSVERRIISEASRIIEAVFSPEATAREKLEEAQKAILGLSLQENTETLRNSPEIVKKTWSEIEKRYQSHGALIGHSTGISDLDSCISGLIPGDLIILAGRPGMGKSAVAGNIAATVAASGVPTLIFSLEMPAEAVMTRIISRYSGINSRNLRRGYLQETQWGKAVEVVGSIARWPLYIDDKSGITPEEIISKSRKMAHDCGLGLLIVDYMQLVRVTGKHDSREQQVAEISRTLKRLARELDIPVIGLSQLNRQVDSRPDKRPLLSDLRESGAIEQDADIIIFIYRDEIYNKSEDNPKRGIAEIDIAKHRNGETGRFEVIFDAKTQTVRNKAFE